MRPNISHHRFFESKADIWEQNETPEKVKRLSEIFTQLQIGIGQRALDVGSGTGILVPILLKRAEPEVSVWEFDFSAQMLYKNKNRWNPSSRPLFHINGDSHLLPFRPDSFDFIACFAVLPHLTDKKKAIREWYRVLVPGGKLLILHLMSSFNLNRLHAEAGFEVENDHLPPVEEVARLLFSQQFSVLISCEEEDLYLLLSEK